MIALTLFLHHKETFGDTYSVGARIDADGDFIVYFRHQHKESYRTEEASAYLNSTQARSLRDKLTELLDAQPAVDAQPEVSAEVQRVAEPAL